MQLMKILLIIFVINQIFRVGEGWLRSLLSRYISVIPSFHVIFSVEMRTRSITKLQNYSVETTRNSLLSDRNNILTHLPLNKCTDFNKTELHKIHEMFIYINIYYVIIIFLHFYAL